MATRLRWLSPRKARPVTEIKSGGVAPSGGVRRHLATEASTSPLTSFGVNWRLSAFRPLRNVDRFDPLRSACAGGFARGGSPRAERRRKGRHLRRSPFLHQLRPAGGRRAAVEPVATAISRAHDDRAPTPV